MPEIETLLLANHAEALNGLLYISGGGFTEIHRPPVPEGANPPSSHFGIAVAVLVPWNETNEVHHLVLGIEQEDGAQVGRFEAALEVGRPPGIRPGTDQRAVLAVNIDMAFPGSGGYRIVADLAGQRRAVSFNVRDHASD